MESIALDVNVGIPCGLIVNELVSNCLKYAFPDERKGIVRVGIKDDNEGNHILTIADNGIGFPEAVDFRSTTSLGLQLVNVLTDQIGGGIVLSNVGGTKFTITFPESNLT
jgi:two-component sensor histidine kinase